jgi:CheY-like chemotaxis protein
MDAMKVPAREASTADPQRRPRVLAVDDQRDAARLLALQLRSGGIDCFLAHDGPSALKFVTEEPVDVIILDVMMPEMDGYEVCQRLKADPRTRDIPVLFLTAKVETEDKVHALGLGGHDYLTKPVQQQELLARTRAALRVKYLQDQLKEKLVLQQEVYRLHQGMLGEHWQKTLGQLASSLAHELNNPLAIALGTVQLLALDESTSPLVQERLQTVDESLQRAARKLRSLLLIAQNDQPTRPIDLAQLVEDILALAQCQVLITGITVRAELERPCGWAAFRGPGGAGWSL